MLTSSVMFCNKAVTSNGSAVGKKPYHGIELPQLLKEKLLWESRPPSRIPHYSHHPLTLRLCSSLLFLLPEILQLEIMSKLMKLSIFYVIM